MDLNKKFPDGVCVSDIRDSLGRQYVDLVQEGGGVHGIALAGYTYVLEKMGISFMKMAGTSAGSINTLLLNAVNTKEEAERLGLKNHYYETRSEKVLEYLADKDLKDFVDGPPAWRKLILGIFSPAFKKKGMRGFVTPYKNYLIASFAALIILIASGFVLLYELDASRNLWTWIFRISFVGLLVSLGLFILKIRSAYILYKLIDMFGVNPGDNFEQWITEKLKENGIKTVEDLTNKLANEKKLLDPKFIPCRPPANPDNPANPVNPGSGYENLLKQIANPSVNVDLLYPELCEIYFLQEQWDEPTRKTFWEQVIRAFEERLAADPVITKELVIVSSDITHGLKVEFPGMHKMYWGHDTTISPARYVRASMSVPLFFKPMEVRFDQKEKKNIQEAWSQMLKVHNDLENHALFVDGGLLSNFPINVFYNAAMPIPRKPTFGIKLEFENDIDSRKIKSFMEFGGSMLNTMRYFYDRDFALKQDLYKKTVRSIDTGKVHWLNFNLTDEEKLELFFRGALAATIFLSRHTTSDEEIERLKGLGSKIPIKEATFSIYGEDGVKFKIEDTEIKNIGFEWQAYKLERLMERLSKAEKTAELKGGAAMKNLKT